MKRNIFLIIPTLAICLLISLSYSCNKILVEKPQSDISPDVFFKTPDQCRQATNGVYSHLPGIFNLTGLWGVTMAGTDLFMFHGGSTSIRDIQSYEFSSATEGNSYSVWKANYAAIKDANFAIARITQSPIQDSIKNQLLGECKFLRAVYYYMLSNIFGGVPLWTEELDVNKIASLPRATLEDVRSQMITDLKYAADNLPISYDAENTDRATKGAAWALLAKIYMLNKDWQNAYNTAKAVMDEHIYELLPSYEVLFDPYNKNKNNKESIFEIQYNRDASTNQNYQVNSFYTWFFPLGDASGGTYAGVDFGSTILQCYAEFYPSQHLVDLYQTDDKRREVALSWGYNGQSFTKFPVPGRPWFGPKFWDLTANRTSSAKDFYFLRYADVIMTAAEAANETGNTAQAILELNKIEERAGLPDLNGSMNQQQLRSFIMDERAREFVGEFQRKWDLDRWGKLSDALQSVAEENASGAQNVKPFHKLFPIPYDEIVKNPKLTQNEGY